LKTPRNLDLTSSHSVWGVHVWVGGILADMVGYYADLRLFLLGPLLQVLQWNVYVELHAAGFNAKLRLGLQIVGAAKSEGYLRTKVIKRRWRAGEAGRL
jgi:hypothetical protein